MQAREFDEASRALIIMGTRIVKRNPIKTSFYLVGVLICLFFSGFKVNETQRQEYAREIAKFDHSELNNVEWELDKSYNLYYRSKGWFFLCDAACQENYRVYQGWQREYDLLKRKESSVEAAAKSKLGLFSEYGVSETRDLFWRRFAQGKMFAKRQSMFDMVFYGVGAMARDESFIKYVVRLVASVLMNLTIGVFLAVVTFILSLWSVISSYQPSFLAGFTYFSLAALAAISYGLTWVIGMYCVAAGTAYVGFTLAKGVLLVESGAPGRRDRIR